MSNTIQGPGSSDRYQPTGPTGGEKSQKASQPTKVHEVKDSDISRVTGDSSSLTGVTPQSTKIDGTHPPLPLPTETFKPEDFPIISASVGEKLTEPISYNTAKERLSKGSEETKKKLSKTADAITDVLNSNRSFDYKAMLVQQLLMSTLGISLDISGEYGKILLNQQTDIQQQRTEEQQKAKEVAEKGRQSNLAGRIFACIADFFNIVAAAFTLVASSITAAATGGAGLPAVVGSVLWLTGAIMSMAGDINGALPKEQQNTTLSGQGFLAAQLTLSIVGMVVTAGGSSLSLAAQKSALEAAYVATEGVATASQMANIVKLETTIDTVVMTQDAIKKFQTSTSLLSTAGTTITKTITAVNQKEMADREAAKVEVDKALSNLQFIQDVVLTKMVKDFMQALTDAGKAGSTMIRTESQLINKIGNV